MVTLTRNLSDVSDAGYISGGSWLPAANPMSVGVSVTAGIRFQNVTVPKNAIISSATVAFTSYAITTGTNFGSAYGEASDNAPGWIDPDVLPDNVTKTTAAVVVPGTSPWTVTAIVQEIVNRAGWASGNALAFVTAGGSDSAVNWANATASQTVLTVIYSVGGGAQLKKVSQVYSAAAWPYVFARGRQPYDARRMSSVLLAPVNDPPFQNAGETTAQQAIALAAAQPNPWGYNFSGGPQPYAPRLPLSAVLLPPAVVNNPPFQNAGETSAQQAIALAMAQPNPWGYTFPGGSQPYAPRVLPADIINYTPPVVPPDNPPFEHPQRSPLSGLYEIAQWQPVIWPPVFIGGRQAYAPRQLPPDIVGLPDDDPPFQAASETAQALAIIQLWQPNPWVYGYLGGRQPYAKGRRVPLSTPVNDPPFRHRGKSSPVLTAIWQWQPDAWPKMYFGGRGPYAKRTLPPVLIAVAPNINIGDKIVRNVVVRQRLVFGPGKEPGLR
jgi:hypothetical protein